MPRIFDKWLNCVFYVYSNEESARTGARGGGTGFFVGIQSKALSSRYHIYGVTNAHIVEHGGSVIRWTSPAGDTRIFPLRIDDWVLHPDEDDVAVYAFEFDSAAHSSFIKHEDFVSGQLIDHFELGVGDDVFMIGRHIDHDGNDTNKPSARFGSISMMADENNPIRQDKRRGHLQESYLIEMRSLAGYSGSPVFAYIPPHTIREISGQPRAFAVYHGPYLLGIDWGHFARKVRSEDENGLVDVYSGMMGVVPAWQIGEVLDLKEFDMKRKTGDKKIKDEVKHRTNETDSGG